MSGDQRPTNSTGRDSSREAFDDALAEIFGDAGEGQLPGSLTGRRADATASPPASRTAPSPPPRRAHTQIPQPFPDIDLTGGRSWFRFLAIGCLALILLPMVCGAVLTLIGLLFPDSSAGSAPGALLLALGTSLVADVENSERR